MRLVVFIRVGAGQAITVRRMTSEGRSVSAWAARSASYRAGTSSWYVPSLPEAGPAPPVQSTSWTCQP